MESSTESSQVPFYCAILLTEVLEPLVLVIISSPMYSNTESNDRLARADPGQGTLPPERATRSDVIQHDILQFGVT